MKTNNNQTWISDRDLLNDPLLVAEANAEVSPIALEEVKLYIKQAACMLDLGVIDKHRGLTFRVFEALGYHKKIITNNSEIATYDFYNPQNILIIDGQNISIPNDFLNSPYAPIPELILKKYRLSNWVETVFKEVI